jgi:hypothetical protein
MRRNRGVPDRLYRVVADSLGFARPAVDLTLGPRGPACSTASPEVCRRLGTEAALVPVMARVGRRGDPRDRARVGGCGCIT